MSSLYVLSRSTEKPDAHLRGLAELSPPRVFPPRHPPARRVSSVDAPRLLRAPPPCLSGSGASVFLPPTSTSLDASLSIPPSSPLRRGLWKKHQQEHSPGRCRPGSPAAKTATAQGRFRVPLTRVQQTWRDGSTNTIPRRQAGRRRGQGSASRGEGSVL